MKVQITESYTGELDGDPDELLNKVREAAEAAIDAVADKSLRKAKPRGGEMAVIDDLVMHMQRRYNERMAQLSADWDKLVDESSDSQ